MPFLAATHAVATVVAEVAVTVSHGDRAAVVTSGGVHLETCELFALAHVLSVIQVGLGVVPVAIAISANDVVEAGQHRRPLGQRDCGAGIRFQTVHDRIRGGRSNFGSVSFVGVVDLGGDIVTAGEGQA